MSLRNEANAMRLRLQQMEDSSANPFSTTGSTPLVTPGIPSSRVEKEQQQSDAGAEEQVKGVQHTSATVAVLEPEKYSRKLLERKIKKVDKMLNKSTPGTKEYKKLQKKRTEYKNQLGEVVKEEYVGKKSAKSDKGTKSTKASKSDTSDKGTTSTKKSEALVFGFTVVVFFPCLLFSL